MSQCEILREWFDAGNSLTVLEALQRFGCYALSQRVGELNREGYGVDSQMIQLESGKRVARYSKARIAYG